MLFETNPQQFLTDFHFLISDLAFQGEQLLNNSLSNPGTVTIGIVFVAGLLTSLGPCSLSLLPVTVAYLAGFKDRQSAFQRSFSFCLGIVLALVVLGSFSGLLGKLYGQIPLIMPILVALIAIIMGLYLLGAVNLPMPQGPNPDSWANKVPKPLAPIAAGLTFGLAASPCTTPILAVLLGWIAQNGNPLTGVLLLATFGSGQVLPLMFAGTIAASIPKLLALRPIGRFVPPISGSILLTSGLLSLFARIT